MTASPLFACYCIYKVEGDNIDCDCKRFVNLATLYLKLIFIHLRFKFLFLQTTDNTGREEVCDRLRQ